MRSKTYPPFVAYSASVCRGHITTKNGRLLTDLDRLQCQQTLNSYLAHQRGVITLSGFIYRLYSWDAVMFLADYEDLWSAWMEEHAEALFYSNVISDVISGHLVVRDLVHMFRCNETPSVQALANAPSRTEIMAVAIRLVVRFDEVKAWLKKRHGREVPNWLISQLDSKEITDDSPIGVVLDKDLSLRDLLHGMAVAGYGYRTDNGRSHAVGKIQNALAASQLVELPPGEDVIRIRLREARDGKPFPIRSDGRSGVLKMVVAMAESHWKYDGKCSAALIEKIRNDLIEKNFIIDCKSIESCLIEAAGS